MFHDFIVWKWLFLRFLYSYIIILLINRYGETADLDDNNTSAQYTKI